MTKSWAQVLKNKVEIKVLRNLGPTIPKNKKTQYYGKESKGCQGEVY